MSGKDHKWIHQCNEWLKLRRSFRSLYFSLLALITCLLCFIISPVLAQVPAFKLKQSPLLIQNITAQTQDLMQQGKALYDAGQFAEAIKVLQQAVKEYHLQEDKLKQAMTWSNLSLAYQQLGRWNEAQEAIASSLNLLEKSTAIPNLQVLAQTLNIQGSQQLELGQAEQALTTWLRVDKLYVQLGAESEYCPTLAVFARHQCCSV